MADDDPAFSEEVLYVTKAEMEAKVQPHGMSDDLGREAIAMVWDRSVEAATTGIGRHLSLIAAQLDNSIATALREIVF